MPAPDASRQGRSRRAARLACAVVLSLLLGCANGVGEGEVTGAVFAPECGIDNTAWDLGANFFVQDTNMNTAVIRIQHGSDYLDLSNGVVLSVHDLDAVRETVGTPIDLADPDAPVSMVLTLAGTCRPGRRDPSVVLLARSGTVTFTAIHDPRENNGPETSGSFAGVVMDDGEEPPSTASLDGYFTFLFARGRPGQRYP